MMRKSNVHWTSRLSAAATLRSVLISGVVVIGVGLTGTACSSARQTQPWCADIGEPGPTDCGYVSFEQCKAAVSGVGGYCRQNPFAGTGRPASGARAWRLDNRSG